MESARLADQPKIRVVVRVRPINTKEKNKGEKDVIDLTSYNSLIVKEIK